MNTGSRRLLPALLLVFAPLALPDPLPELGIPFEQATITLVATGPACYGIDVYVAASHEQRLRGLMFVRKLPTMAGMLFVYGRDDYLSMWMKNTFIPLDILFIRADGTIASIARDTEPQSLKSVGAEEPVRYVLELNAGATGHLGIETGSYIVL